MTAALDSALDDALEQLDGPEPDARPAPYVTAVRVDQLVVDRTYQRDVDEVWVQKTAVVFDPTLLGVLEVSDRGGDVFAIVDGQHRAALVREAHPAHGDAHVVVQVHRGLTVEQEAHLFHTIAAKRKQMTWWDLWKSLRASGDQATADLERVLAQHGLQVHPAGQTGNIRAVSALRRIVADFGGLGRLSEVLSIITAAFGKTVDAFDAATLLAVALILEHYEYRGDDAELDLERLVNEMRTITPRQLRARAIALREAHKAEQPRLFAAVLIGLYNSARGRNVEEFLVRVPSSTRQKTRNAQTRHLDAIFAWAQQRGLLEPGAQRHRIPQAIRDQYDATHPTKD